MGAADNYTVSLSSSNELEEVVVTSLGIKREKQALGYAISEVDNESIEQRAEGDIGRVLAGKASGVQITNQSGVYGSGTSIIIRGFNTFSQGNQPLFIVDGVPFSSETNAQDRFVDGNNALIEAYTGNDSSGTSQITIPANAQNMSFEFIRGSFPGECSFTIKYTALDGSNAQNAFSESNPAAGEKVLSICQ